MASTLQIPRDKLRKLDASDAISRRGFVWHKEGGKGVWPLV